MQPLFLFFRECIFFLKGIFKPILCEHFISTWHQVLLNTWLLLPWFTHGSVHDYQRLPLVAWIHSSTYQICLNAVNFKFSVMYSHITHQVRLYLHTIQCTMHLCTITLGKCCQWYPHIFKAWISRAKIPTIKWLCLILVFSELHVLLVCVNFMAFFGCSVKVKGIFWHFYFTYTSSKVNAQLFSLYYRDASYA